MSDPVLNGGDIGQKGTVTKFINHIFDFGDDSKKDLMNLVQFSVLAIVPLILLNKSIYNIDDKRFDQRLNELVDMLDIFVSINSSIAFI